MSVDPGGRDLRVLLMSPLPDVDPFNGDVIYSRALLEQPPPGVTYVRYDEALASGEVREHGRRQSIHEADSLGQRAKAVAEVSRNHTRDALRSAGALFREPFRFLEIVGSFDLVHCHTFSVNWTGRTTPVLVSNAVPLTELYARAGGGARLMCGWPATRTASWPGPSECHTSSTDWWGPIGWWPSPTPCEPGT